MSRAKIIILITIASEQCVKRHVHVRGRILCAFVVSVAGMCGNSSVDNAGSEPVITVHIVGGRNAMHGEFPWQVTYSCMSEEEIPCTGNSLGR